MALSRLLVLSVLLLGTVACRTSDSQPPQTTPTPGVQASATPEAECEDLTGGGAEAEIVMTDFRYQPTCAIVGVNQGIALTNEGSVVHNFSLEGPDVDLDVAAGEEGRFEAIGGIAQPGVHTLFCKYHRDAGMFGELRIRD